MKINFVDFWGGFVKNNNYFYHLLNANNDIIIDEQNPDIVFFSVFGNSEIEKYKNHRCKKIFYTGENCRANLDGPWFTKSNGFKTYLCDFAFTFDFINHERHYRLPLWVMQIDWFNKGGYENPEYILPLNGIHENEYISTKKTKFCATIFNNQENKRIEIYRKLNEYKKVDGYGQPFNNWFYGESNKYKVLSNYKFSICFENSLSPHGGYYTEKLFHAKTSGTIPIYWTDNYVGHDFNVNCFINYKNYKSIEDLIEYIIQIDNNENLYRSILNEPLFKEYKMPDFAKPENILKAIKENLC